MRNSSAKRKPATTTRTTKRATHTLKTHTSTSRQPRFITCAEYSRRCGVESSVVSRAVMRGDIVLVNGLVDWRAADESWAKARAARHPPKDTNAYTRKRAADGNKAVATAQIRTSKREGLHAKLANTPKEAQTIEGMIADAFSVFNARAQLDMACGESPGAAFDKLRTSMEALQSEALKVTQQKVKHEPVRGMNTKL